MKILILLVGLAPLYCMGQSSGNDVLKGLTKLDKNELKLRSKELQFDGESIPVYLPEGTRVKGMEMMQAIQSDDYNVEFYKNTAGEIKAIYLKQLSEEEKAKQKEYIAKARSEKPEQPRTPAKDFTAVDFEKKRFSLKELKGKIVVINFWFTSCKPCLVEIPELNKLVDKYSGKDVVFLGITFDNQKALQKFLTKKEFKYHLVPNAKKIIDDYKVNSYPTHIVIDKDSKVAFSINGLSSQAVHEVDDTIEKLLK
ncbi:TlpA disulfide reductase family protein [Chryseobacterium sp. OSA05B]|uniref:TlpA family protein disulfide reductase n=1 Tax=Chryseobacterium sp. OSA05B TaxID=2862650 RepID=UPI001CBCCE2D|nr:TlpA disulfide reductase family protein [Chryseobacterium sp. OSA05B]